MRPLLALFIRSLRDDVRSKATYLLRSGLVGLILLFLYATHERTRWAGAPGRSFFTTVLWIDLFILCVVGLSYFTSAIAEEKDDDTLGLLRMTDLSALAILLGKSTSRMLGALLLIAAQLPFMLVAVTMGGLDVRQVLAGFTLLLAFAFHIANLALVGSVVCARTSSATALTAVLLAAFAFLPGVLDFDAHVLFHPGEPLARFCQGWIDATPVARLEQITATGFRGSPLGLHFAVNVALGVAWFGVAWVLFDRHAERAGEPDPDLLPAAPGPGVAIQRYGRPASHALRWKDFYFISGGYVGAIVRTMIAVGLLAVFIIGSGSDARHGIDALAQFGGMIFFASSLVLVLSLAVDASRIFKAERRDQTLSSLALLPGSIRQLVWEKVRGCLVGHWVLVGMVALGLALLAPKLLPELQRDLERSPKFFLQGSAVVLCFAISALQLPLSVAWMSLRVRWGGLPIGFTAWALGNYGAVALGFAAFRDGALIALPVAGSVVVAWLALDIPRRLERLAAGE